MKIIFKRRLKHRPGKGFAIKFTLCIKQTEKVYYCKIGALGDGVSRHERGGKRADRDWPGPGWGRPWPEGKKKACRKAGRIARRWVSKAS